MLQAQCSLAVAVGVPTSATVLSAPPPTPPPIPTHQDMEHVATIKVPVELGLVKSEKDYSIMLKFK